MDPVSAPTASSGFDQSAGIVTSPHPTRLAIVVSHPIQYYVPLFRHLARRTDLDVTVLYSSLSGAQDYWDAGFGTTVKWDLPMLDGYRYKVLRSYFAGKRDPVSHGFSPGVVTEIIQGHYDAVMVFGWGRPTSWLAFWGAWLSGVPWMLHGDTNVIYEKEKRGLRGKLRKLVLRTLLNRTSAFLTTGTFNREFYRYHGASPDKCFMVPLAVDNDYFAERAQNAKADRAKIRRRYAIPQEAVLLLFVGKLVACKRPQDLLYAIASLRGSQVWAAFAGDGELMPYLRSEAQRLELRNVCFLGFRNQSELPEIYGISDVLVLPSSRDHKPLATNEAMACGLPVIASDRTGVWGPGDIVRDGENGFVYPCGDIPRLAQAITSLVIDCNLRVRMGERSRAIIQTFGYERCTEGILTALHSLGPSNSTQHMGITNRVT